MIEYTEDIGCINEEMLTGFFDGWPSIASCEKLKFALSGEERR